MQSLMATIPTAKAFLSNIQPYQPGKAIERLQREAAPTGPIIKMASNENPYPMHDDIKQAIIAALDVLNRYPETGAPVLTQQLSKLYSVNEDEIFIGNGSNEILDLLVRAYVEQQQNCVFSELSFAIYKLICKQCGVAGIEVPCRNYSHDLKAMAAAITSETKIVFVCNPNNPTGTYNNTTELEQFLAKVPKHVMVVLDEAYYEFASADDYPDSLKLRTQYPNLVILRTFSKYYSLAGLRIGYAIAHPAITDILHKLRQPFNVNRLAQIAASAALKIKDQLDWYLQETIQERESMRKQLIELGCDCPASQTNFLFVVPKSHKIDICAQLEKQGIIVRPMTTFGGPTNSFRVNMATPDENKQFITLFKQNIL